MSTIKARIKEDNTKAASERIKAAFVFAMAVADEWTHNAMRRNRYYIIFVVSLQFPIFSAVSLKLNEKALTISDNADIISVLIAVTLKYRNERYIMEFTSRKDYLQKMITYSKTADIGEVVLFEVLDEGGYGFLPRAECTLPMSGKCKAFAILDGKCPHQYPITRLDPDACDEKQEFQIGDRVFFTDKNYYDEPGSYAGTIIKVRRWQREKGYYWTYTIAHSGVKDFCVATKEISRIAVPKVQGNEYASM